DDPELLDLMLGDQERQSPMFRTTNYYKFYDRALLPELREMGLHDYRRRRNSRLNTFGATDLKVPLIEFHPERHRFLRSRPSHLLRLPQLLRRIVERVPRDQLIDDAVYQKLCYGSCASMAIGSSARPLSEVSVSTIGNPEDT